MNQERNASCACGSGRKFKKCCGAPAPVVAVQPQSVRSCGGCMKCCEGWLAGPVRREGVVDHVLMRGSPCPHATSGRCAIYDSRPEDPCKSFVCGWLMPASPLPESYRPDKLGVIFVQLVWRQRRAWALVPAGGDIGDDLKARMRAYTQATGEPHLLKYPERLLCYGSAEFQQDMVAKAERGENPWDP